MPRNGPRTRYVKYTPARGEWICDEVAVGRPIGEVCAEPFRHYCDAVRAGIDEALRRGARVLVVSQPYVSDAHVAQQRHLVALLRARYGNEPRVAHLDLGTAIDLRDSALAFDGMHLTPREKEILLAGGVLALTRSKAGS